MENKWGGAGHLWLFLESPLANEISVNYHCSTRFFFPNATMEVIRCSVSSKDERMNEGG